MEGLSEMQKPSAKSKVPSAQKILKTILTPPLNYQFYAFRDNGISMCV